MAACIYLSVASLGRRLRRLPPRSELLGPELGLRLLAAPAELRLVKIEAWRLHRCARLAAAAPVEVVLGLQRRPPLLVETVGQSQLDESRLGRELLELLRTLPRAGQQPLPQDRRLRRREEEVLRRPLDRAHVLPHLGRRRQGRRRQREGILRQTAAAARCLVRLCARVEQRDLVAGGEDVELGLTDRLAVDVRPVRGAVEQLHRTLRRAKDLAVRGAHAGVIDLDLRVRVGGATHDALTLL
mmetsp:Transcript_28948/g.95206  ORF Transcript_28948/g.95206 Transcript_28948/m.95206 type:complete len:242 (-) Transcript_28948:255-980(-)